VQQQTCLINPGKSTTKCVSCYTRGISCRTILLDVLEVPPATQIFRPLDDQPRFVLRCPSHARPDVFQPTNASFEAVNCNFSPKPALALSDWAVQSKERPFSHTAAQSYELSGAEAHCEQTSTLSSIPEKKPQLPIKPLAYRHSMPLLRDSVPVLSIQSQRNPSRATWLQRRASVLANSSIPERSHGATISTARVHDRQKTSTLLHTMSHLNRPTPTGVNYWMQTESQIHRMLPEWKTKFSQLVTENFATKLDSDKEGLERWIRSLASLEWEIGLVLAIEQCNDTPFGAGRRPEIERAACLAIKIRRCIIRAYARYNENSMQLPLEWRMIEPLVQKMEPVWRRRIDSWMAISSFNTSENLEGRLRTMRSIEAEITYTVVNEPASGKVELDNETHWMMLGLMDRIRFMAAKLESDRSSEQHENALVDLSQVSHHAQPANYSLQSSHSMSTSQNAPTQSPPRNSDSRSNADNRYSSCTSFASTMVAELNSYQPNRSKVTANQIITIVLRGTCWAGLSKVLINKGIRLPYRNGLISGSPWVDYGHRFASRGLFWLGDLAIENECRICPVCLDVLFCGEQKEGVGAYLPEEVPNLRVPFASPLQQEVDTSYTARKLNSRPNQVDREAGVAFQPADNDPEPCEWHKYHFEESLSNAPDTSDPKLVDL
jgi:hypothetical protein